MRVRCEAGARLHVGFQNLSLARDRLYGGLGLALGAPTAVVEAEPAPAVDADPALATTAERVCDRLGVEGARVRLVEGLPRHQGLGSGTQHALATLAAVATAHDEPVRPREHAPALGRGGRSGVGVATFESGGFVVDAGHPVERFTTRPPDRGEWTVPPVTARHPVPEEWRVLLVVPDAAAGRHGGDEDEGMRSVVERADPTVSDELAGVLTRRVLPALVEADLPAFGRAVQRFGRLNGAWYADEQGGIYRPPAGRIIEALERTAVTGVGQSSWGPAVYALTDAEGVEAARAAGERALEAADIDGEVLVTPPRNHGAVLRTR